MHHASLEIVCGWIIKVWNAIQSDVLQNSFKKCSITNNLDGTEDDYLFIDHSSSDGKNETEFDNVFEDNNER